MATNVSSRQAPAPVDPGGRVDLGGRLAFLRAFVAVGPLPPLLIALVIFFALMNARFYSVDNLLGISQQSVPLLLIAIGQMLVLISGGFDLSVGAAVVMSSVFSATLMSNVYGGQARFETLGLLWGIIGAICVGAGLGLLNGLGVAFLKVNPFIVTLATGSIFTSVTLIVSKGSPVTGLPSNFIDGLGSGRVFGIPSLVLLAIPFVIGAFAVLRWTAYGRHVYALGGNSAAAFTAGISTRRVLIVTYILCSLLGAVAGFALTGWSGSGQPVFGADFALQSIAAAVIGGTSLRGGRGGVVGTVLGVVFIAVLGNGMNFMSIDSNYQNIALGAALVLAVLADRLRVAGRQRIGAARVLEATKTGA